MINTNSKGFKAYLLLNERNLELDELKIIFKEYDETGLLTIVCLSIYSYLEELKEKPILLNNKYLDNLKITIIKLVSSCEQQKIGETLNTLKKIEGKCLSLEGQIKDKLVPYINELQDLLIHKLNDTRYNSYDFLSMIIYEIKSIPYLKQILNTYPHYINTRNPVDKHIALELIDKLLVLLDEQNDENIMYYNSAILEFINRSRFHIDTNDLKQYCLKLDILLRRLDKNDENYKKKFSFYKSILNHLLNTERTTESIEIINTKYGIRKGFDFLIQDELKKLNQEDFIITIDSEETLDMDDAMSIKFVDDHYHLKVYIADVARIIKSDSLIDKEALRRCETLYLSDLIISMLPTELSNDILSLNNRSYKNVICFEMNLYMDGSIDNFQISRDRILVNKNFSYDQVNLILKFGDMDYKIYETLTNLSEAANILRRCSQQKTVYRMVEDQVNKEKRISNKKNDYSQRTCAEIIIEEIMILINVLTAQLFSERNYPFMYRVHQECSLKSEYQSLINLRDLLETSYDDKKNIKLINCLINMYPQAYYSFENIGHYGLDKLAYCHASAPVRRYPDIVVQRLIYDYIFSLPTKEKDLFWEPKIKELCVYCNDKMQHNRLYQSEYEQAKVLIKKLSC